MSFDKRAFWQDLLTNKTPPKATAFLGFELIAFDPANAGQPGIW